MAELIRDAKTTVVITGNDFACLPDDQPRMERFGRINNGKDDDVEILGGAKAKPTASHMALFELMKKGLVNHIVTSTTDGLHWLSGVPKVRITEIHGKSYALVCSSCGTEYPRTFEMKSEVPVDGEYITDEICS